jgi:hypothetical protein
MTESKIVLIAPMSLDGLLDRSHRAADAFSR